MSWQNTVIKYADLFGVPRSIALMNIEAESGGRHDAIGDSGNALGAGQVWPKWHYGTMQEIQRLLGTPALPAQTDLYGLQQYVKSHPEYSYALGVKVTANYWQSKGPNLVDFLKGYVGPKVPSAEIVRRQNILSKYQGHDQVYSPGSGEVWKLPGVSKIGDTISIATSGLDDKAIAGIMIALAGLILAKGFKSVLT